MRGGDFTKKKSVIIAVVLLAALVFAFASGVRLTPESAARANGNIGGNAVLAAKADTAPGTVLVYQKNNYFITAVPARFGPFWISPGAVITTEHVNDKKGRLRTMGWYSSAGFSQKGTVLIVQVKDADVAAIAAGPVSHRRIKKVKSNHPVIFSWGQSYLEWQLNAAALSADGSKLYTCGYPKSTPNASDSKELRWYAVKAKK